MYYSEDEYLTISEYLILRMKIDVGLPCLASQQTANALKVSLSGGIAKLMALGLITPDESELLRGLQLKLEGTKASFVFDDFEFQDLPRVLKRTIPVPRSSTPKEEEEPKDRYSFINEE